MGDANAAGCNTVWRARIQADSGGLLEAHVGRTANYCIYVSEIFGGGDQFRIYAETSSELQIRLLSYFADMVTQHFSYILN